jgi:hypothetical protein
MAIITASYRRICFVLTWGKRENQLGAKIDGAELSVNLFRRICFVLTWGKRENQLGAKIDGAGTTTPPQQLRLQLRSKEQPTIVR